MKVNLKKTKGFWVLCIYEFIRNIYKKIGDQAQCGAMYQSPQVLRNVCELCTFIREISKLYKLVENYLAHLRGRMQVLQTVRKNHFKTYGAEPYAEPYGSAESLVTHHYSGINRITELQW